MKNWRLLPRARGDLTNIWNFTAERWDADQAERYLRLLHAATEIVAANPKIGSPRDELRAGYRSYRAGSHLIFYRLTAREIVIVRILHQRMDSAAQL